MNDPLRVKLCEDEVIVNGGLHISFRRTIRVPDNQQVSYLPPDLGVFPLRAVFEHAGKTCSGMSAKGGLFFPMWQSEAMWINFSCTSERKYMIKIYVGGVNVISGEPAIEDGATKLRRQAKLAAAQSNGEEEDEPSPLQDYVVVSEQPWLDSIADSVGTIRQFVAMPFGSGHSVEHQVTGKDSVGGIQFEITPYAPKPGTYDYYHERTPPQHPSGPTPIFLKLCSGRTQTFYVDLDETVDKFKERIWVKEGTYPCEPRLIFSGKQLEEGRTLRGPYKRPNGESFEMGPESTIHMVFRLRGGSWQPPREQMTVAAGGRIKQYIAPDTLGSDWRPAQTTVFNVQILNAAVFQAVTGQAPLTHPLTAAQYANLGMPFFKLYEEPSDVYGLLSRVLSVAQIEGDEDEEVEPNTVEINSPEVPVGLTNPNGPLREFRTVAELEKQMARVHIAEF